MELIQACKSGDERLALTLFQRGDVDVNFADQNGCVAAHWAAREGNESIMKLLIDNNANLSLVDSQGRTPLLIAARQGHDEIVKSILKVYPQGIRDVDEDGATSLILACESEGLQQFNIRSSNVNPRQSSMESISAAMLNALMQPNIFGNRISTATTRQSEFGSAFNLGRFNVITMLIAHGADIEAKSNIGETSLMRAANNGLVEAVRILIGAGAIVNQIDAEGFSALEYACREGHIVLVQLLLDAGASWKSVTEEAFEWFLESFGGAVNSVAIDIVSSLMKSDVCECFSVQWQETLRRMILAACLTSNLELLRLILRSKTVNLSHIVNQHDENGVALLQLVAGANKIPMIVLLLQAGATLEQFSEDNLSAILTSFTDPPNLEAIRAVIACESSVPTPPEFLQIIIAAAGRGMVRGWTLRELMLNDCKLWSYFLIETIRPACQASPLNEFSQESSSAASIHDISYSDLCLEYVRLFPSLLSVTDEQGRLIIDFADERTHQQLLLT